MAQKNGVHIVSSFSDFSHKKIEVFWLLIPQGELVDKVIAQLQPLLSAGDIIVDGIPLTTNLKNIDDVRRFLLF